jgi:predicted O-methyltransferase YrrM
MFLNVPPPPVPAFQNLHEIGCLFDHVALRPHARVLEIGSLYGGTLWYWSHLPSIELLVSVDLPSEWPAVAEGVREARPNWGNWFSPRCQFYSITGDSHHPHTLDRARGFAPFDFMFIDGDHTYEGVRDDWRIWDVLLVPWGVVAFHDTWPNFDRHEPGVVRWVDELRHEMPSIEWTDPDGVGITAFTKGA